MFLIFWIRIINDLAFYYSFAGCLVSLSGNACCLSGLLLPSFFCALSLIIREARPRNKALSYATSACSVLCLILPGLSVWGRAALLPVLAYMGYLTHCGRMDLSRENRKDVLLLFCRSYPIFFVLFALLGGLENLLRFSLPCALLTMILCICLMRLLRYDEEVRRRPFILLTSLLPVALLVLLGRLLSLPAVLNTAGSAFFTVYNRLVIPVLSAVLYGCAYVIFALITPILSLLSGNTDDTLDQTIATEEDELSSLSGTAGSPALPYLLMFLKVLCVLIVVFLAALLLYQLFRRLAGTHRAGIAGTSAEEIRQKPNPAAASAERHLPRSPLHPVNRIRRQYRAYLKLCRQNGLNPPCFYTTQDIEKASAGFIRDQDAASQLRQLYLKARYHGAADAADAIRAEELVRRLSK